MSFLPHDVSAAELMAALTSVAENLARDLTPHEAGGEVLRRGIAALGAAGGVVIVDSREERLEITELGSATRVPTVVAELIARADEAWTGTVALVRIGVERANVLALWFDTERSLAEVERSFVRMLGLILAQAIERSRLRVEQRIGDLDRAKRARSAELLSAAFRLVSSGASPLKHIMDELSRVSCQTPADLSAIRVLSADRSTLELVGLHHRGDAEQIEALRASLDPPLPANIGSTSGALASGKSLLLPTVDMDQLIAAHAGTRFADYMTRYPVSTIMVVPLISRGVVFGVVTVARKPGGEPFQPADLRFVEEVADRATLALETSNLLETLALSEEHLRIALAAGRLGAWEWNIHAGTVTWSTMLEEIHGLAPGAFTGTFDAYQQDIHPDDRETVLASIQRALVERTDHHVVYRILRPDGEMRWLQAHGRLVRDSTGTPQRLVGVCEDITERRNADEHLREMVLALKTADQRKDEFLAMLAHELRNPLSPMLNATYLLRVIDDRQEAAHWVDVLDRQVHHMARLLDDLLDVSRITRGKVELVRDLVDLTMLAREVVDDHAESFKAGGIVLELASPAAQVLVDGDRTRLAQIVGNLLSNALKFSERGQTVNVSIAIAGETVVLSVRDRGAGIAPGFIATMFEPFVQADTSLSRSSGGLGLGLAVVKGLVTLHGGHVSATSAGVGQGAELRVELPLHAGTHEPVAAKEPAPTPSRDQPTVLIFEDNADAADSLRMILSSTGYRVQVEATGRHAIDMVRRFRPAVVLCDLGLPDRDGYAIAAELRADRECVGLPLIAISGYGSAEDQARALHAGFDLHLTKPVPPAVLLAELAGRITS